MAEDIEQLEHQAELLGSELDRAREYVASIETQLLQLRERIESAREAAVEEIVTRGLAREEDAAAENSSRRRPRKPGGATNPRMCKVEGCPNRGRRGGICVRHGAWEPRCGVEGCTNKIQYRGLCCRHGGRREHTKVYYCKEEGCTKQAKKGGRCMRHGGGTRAKKSCAVEGCEKQAKNGGLCYGHGARKPVRKACSIEGCATLAVNGGLCTKHTAADAKKKCSREGCKNLAHTGSLCFSHSSKNQVGMGIRKRCSRDDCRKFAADEGLYCVDHGEGPKKKKPKPSTDLHGSPGPRPSFNDIGRFRVIFIPPCSKLGLTIEFSEHYSGAWVKAVNTQSCQFADQIGIGDRIVSNSGRNVNSSDDLRVGGEKERRFGIIAATEIDKAEFDS